MKIKVFVKTALKELSEALSESKTELGKRVSLTNVELRKTSRGNYGLIDFDLAVEAQSKEATGGKAGLGISVVEARIGKNKETSTGNTSRIKFTVEADF